jgi:effector-binding domain-containing protein
MSYEIHLQQLRPTNTAVVRKTTTIDEIGPDLGRIYSEVMEYLGHIGMPRAIQAIARYVIHEDGRTVDIEAGFSTDRPVQPSGRIEPGQLPGGEAAVCLHIGAYDQVSAAYEALSEWMKRNERESSSAPWECYLSMPDEVPPRTEVVFPLQPAPSVAHA